LTENKTVSVKIYLPEDLRARFKSACALQKISMNEVLLDFVEEWTAKNEKPPASSTSAKGTGGKGRGKDD
jgi:hypothetical protein